MEINTAFQSMINLSQKKSGASDTAAFATDVNDGLSQDQKSLPSRYFYDGEGSRLFQEIMELPEYYLTRAEYEVLTENKEAIAREFAGAGFFHLIDLGAGDALKTKILLQQLTVQQSAFSYIPVDISGDILQQLSGSLQTEMPALSMQAVVGEYSKALEWLQANKSGRKVVLFLGSNIGNFKADESRNFLCSVRAYLQPGDKLLMGIDLRKDPDVILRAYDDAAGVTAAFNLNLLRRINRELGGNFDLDQFRHYALYNPQDGVMRSYLVSKKEQEVYIRDLQKSFHFAAWETIHTENSHKYTLPQVQDLGMACGFTLQTVFQDKNKRFADVLFSVD
ncbi:L-histidine N(alpha)-methyltransferase [Pontibacter sp. 172403-2]|uniref:L-histidine N(alpha)-methyltransferase n=1 Tax=Pontibacter rufus TaxID=2791028 RepID=UPI0018AF891A|nr:L-histidine N(alpha)-methyltransferase [Pontibacter sp. 172403-2]MBF9254271.1 L-histidine N(alpha)-methyltransferase [Pontibacter sp. 172403-2]